jgi:hypothetical protein
MSEKTGMLNVINKKLFCYHHADTKGERKLLLILDLSPR